MCDYTAGQIRRGHVPWVRFRYVGFDVVTDRKITHATPGELAPVQDVAARKLAIDRAVSVLVACQAINRMMGKHPNTGMYGED